MEKVGADPGQKKSMAPIVAIIVLAFALIAVLIFAGWAYSGRQNYKDNSDKRVAIASAAAAKQAADTQKKTDDEVAKLPVLTFTGPATYGAVSFNYPRDWNGFVDESDSGNPIKALFYKGIVPANGVFYALRVDLLSTDYASAVKSFDGAVKKGTVTATAYVPPDMVGKPNVQTGTRFDGTIEDGVQGSMVVLRVRDKTLKIYTESPTYLDDFNNKVLLHLTYIP